MNFWVLISFVLCLPYITLNKPLVVAVVVDDNVEETHIICLISYIRHEDFSPAPPSFVTLRGPPLDSEMDWTGELWSNRVLLICEN